MVYSQRRKVSTIAKPSEKTNVMRLLDSLGIAYTPHSYDASLTDGRLVADAVGKTHDETFKTLVTVGASGKHYVFCVPVAGSLSLGKAARAVHEKSVVMIPQKELLPLTGYVHGGCSPIGMKKRFDTVIDETAMLFDTVCVSAGRLGFQVELAPDALIAAVGAAYHDIAED